MLGGRLAAEAVPSDEHMWSELPNTEAAVAVDSKRVLRDLRELPAAVVDALPRMGLRGAA